MGVELPHFAQEFKITKKGAVVDEQGSVADIAACIYRTAVCPEGFRVDLPTFGIPDISFSTPPLPLDVIQASLERWEPRADLELAEHANALEDALREIIVEVEPNG